MKNLLLVNFILILGWNAWAINPNYVRVTPDKKFVTFEIDGKFPPGAATDVLFVVDDSGSMSDHQENLARNIELFAEEAVKTNNDFHIGIINTMFRKTNFPATPHEVGELLGHPKVLDMTTPYLVDVLKKNLKLGTNGSGEESVFEPVMAALSAENSAGMNAGFLRDQAHLSIIVLSDAEDQSQHSPWEFADFLVDLKGSPDNVTLQGFLVTAADHQAKTCKAQLGEDAPFKIEEAIRLLSGKSYSLCSATMAENVEALAQDVFPPFKGQFKPGILIDNLVLVGKPVVETIKVQFGKQTLVEDRFKGWTYDEANNQILFGSQIQWMPQASSTKIVVTYKPE